ncbi:NUDIX hydrolase [Candidatus Dojkabacteria bacterium]|nr:NUDIX hydrolase [Candidatus Dojkabacteria bacterium]
MKFITAKQYQTIKDIPRSRLTARFLVYTGAIIEKGGKVLLCKPIKSKYPGWQLPGGKVLWSEDIREAVCREVLEETGLTVELQGLIGIFERKTEPEDEEFLRVIFTASIKGKPIKIEDPEIAEINWFDPKDILNEKVPLQTKQMLKEFDRYVKGKSFPLEVIDIYTW